MSDNRTMRLSQCLFKFKRASQEAVKRERSREKKSRGEMEEAKGFNEIIQTLRKEKNEQIAKREDVIQDLERQTANNRQSLAADKDTIDNLNKQIEDKNIELRDYDSLMRELWQKEQTIEDLKRRNSAKEKAEREKIHRLGHEIEDKNTKLHEVNQQIEQVASEKQLDLAVVQHKLACIENKASHQQSEIQRLRNENQELLRTLGLQQDEIQECNDQIADLRQVNASAKRLIDALTKEIQQKDTELQASEALLEKFDGKLGRREKKIAGLKEKRDVNRRLSLADKETIDNLWAENAQKSKELKELQNKVEEPKDGGLGGIFIKTKKFRFYNQVCEYSYKLLKRVKLMKGFEDGIWEKKRVVVDDDMSGSIQLWFNYLGEDIMLYPGVKDLTRRLRNDENVKIVKIEAQRFIHDVN